MHRDNPGTPLQPTLPAQAELPDGIGDQLVPQGGARCINRLWVLPPWGTIQLAAINKHSHPWLSAFCSFLHSTSSCKKTTNQTSTQCAFQMVDKLRETGGKDVMKNPDPHTVIPEASYSAKGV